MINAIDPQRADDHHVDMLGQLLLVAVDSAQGAQLTELKDNWLFRRILESGGSTDPWTGSLQYRLLMVAERDHDPLVLANLSGSRYLGSTMTPERAVDTANQPWTTKAVNRETLAMSLQTIDSMRVVEPLADSITIARDAMRNGNLDLANAFATRPLQERAEPPTLARAHLLLTRIALRRPNLPKAVHHITELRKLYKGYSRDLDKMPKQAHVDLVEGELAYAQFVAGEQGVNNARPFFERARDRFAGEVFGLGRYEVARKIDTMRVFDGGLGFAVHGLRTTLAATAYPLLLPVHYRTAISIAKLGVIGGNIEETDINECRRAAEFFSTSPAFDRYWYAEALLVLTLAETRSSALLALLRAFRSPDDPPPELTPLERAARRELNAIGRSAKVALLAQTTKLDTRSMLLD